MERPILEVSNLSIVHSAEGVETTLLDDLSYSVFPGETLAIVGESGSGKSLSSLAIMGLLSYELRVTKGSVNFEGVDLLTLLGTKRCASVVVAISRWFFKNR